MSDVHDALDEIAYNDPNIPDSEVIKQILTKVAEGGDVSFWAKVMHEWVLNRRAVGLIRKMTEKDQK